MISVLETAYAPGLSPPEGFSPAGRVAFAQLTTAPSFTKTRRSSAQKQGIRYEREVQAYLSDLYGLDYLPSPWIRFESEGRGLRFCQPDGLLFQPEKGRITIVEIKYQHTPLAWWQLLQLYAPVVAKLFPKQLWILDVCEVVKWYDAGTIFPVRPVLAAQVHMPIELFKVHIYRP
jgi:hypothetical protein